MVALANASLPRFLLARCLAHDAEHMSDAAVQEQVRVHASAAALLLLKGWQLQSSEGDPPC